jgi:2-polyprenyl-3-methyl-5-hydroxy-6-metoxy-1,4-benzoquinol methylase
MKLLYLVDHILRAVPSKGRLVGMDLVEVNSYYDPTGVTAQTAARLTIDLLGAALPSKAAGTERLTYFGALLGDPEWSKAKVLDVGGNWGASLETGRINEENYWCLDVSRDAIERGKRMHPRAHWVFYDRYNFCFNPTGIRNLAPPLGDEKFDYILSYSVFTHTSKAEMIELVASLRTHLTPEGKFAFTFIDPHYVLPDRYSGLFPGKHALTNLHLRMENIRLQDPTAPVDEMLRQAAGCTWCTIINDREIYVDHEQIRDYAPETEKFYDTFYTAECMAKIFPEAIILAPPRDYDTAGNLMQHCVVVGSPDAPQRP